jgi:3-hydroxyisobutyrate dehydrogenase-like beta-hydroxyacid dehydrogenase
MSSIGFIGAGAMGEPMAARLLRQAGHDVLVWARRPERAREFEDAGFAVGTLDDALTRPVVVTATSRAVAAVLAARRIDYVDAPVSGGRLGPPRGRW